MFTRDKNLVAVTRLRFSHDAFTYNHPWLTLAGITMLPALIIGFIASIMLVYFEVTEPLRYAIGTTGGMALFGFSCGYIIVRDSIKKLQESDPTFERCLVSIELHEAWLDTLYYHNVQNTAATRDILFKHLDNAYEKWGILKPERTDDRQTARAIIAPAIPELRATRNN